jgi:putative oxygen-independent coproporphyrinogen III oxidase
MKKLSRTLGIYVHWPFCQKKCPYCDFNSHVRPSYNEEAWKEGIKKEIYYWYEWLTLKDLKKKNSFTSTTQDFILSSIFFGGGTPSLMNPKSFEEIIFYIQQLFNSHIQGPIEITAEANPSSVEAEKFKSLSQTGVNRVSIGVQSFNPNGLKVLGRLHDENDAKKAIELGQQYFKNVSFDLIYGWPEHDLEEWENQLKQALSYKTKHLSLYQLTIEPKTAFYQRYKNNRLILPHQNILDDMFDMTQEMSEKASIPSYETSNHSFFDESEKNDYRCQHNLGYWKYHDFIGVGPGAHGRLSILDFENENKHNTKKIATDNESDPQAWLEKIKNKNHGIKEILLINEKKQIEEQLMMGLRLKEGIDLSSLPEDWKNHIHLEGLDQLIKKEIIIINNKKIKTSLHGWRCLNSVLHHLFI